MEFEHKPLSKLRVCGFRSIKDANLELKGINVLLGTNGAGKSNLIAVFQLLSDSINGYLQVHTRERGGASRLLHFGRKQTETLQLHLNFQETNGYEIELKPDTEDAFFYSQETVWSWDRGKNSISLGTGQKESRLAKPSETGVEIANHVLARLKGARVYHFHDTSRSSPLKTKQTVADIEFLRPDGGNLAPFLYHLQENHRPNYDRILRTVRFVAPFIRDFRLKPDSQDLNSILLEWEHEQSDAYFNASDLSDGTLRFICLATLLLQPSPPSIIVMDEPELGLHPTAIQVLVELFKEVSQRAQSSQLVVATQSVTLVNQLEPGDIISTECRAGQSSFARLSTEKLESWLRDYTLGQLWEGDYFRSLSE